MTTPIEGRDDLLSAVPFIVGFHPMNSWVLILGNDTEIEGCIRMDIPEKITPELIHRVLEGFESSNCGSVIMLAYVDNEDLYSPDFIKLYTAIESKVEVMDALIVNSTHYKPLTNDWEPRPIPDWKNSRVAADRIAAGSPIPFDSKEAMIESIKHYEFDEELETLVTSSPKIDYNADESTIRERQRDGVVEINTMVAYFKNKQLQGLRKSTIARTIAALQDTQVRDYALGLNFDDIKFMWKWLLSKSPKGYKAPLACLYAFTAYETGDGAQANAALELAEDDNPSYTLTDLLSLTFQGQIHPRTFQRMRDELHPTVLKSLGLRA